MSKSGRMLLALVALVGLALVAAYFGRPGQGLAQAAEEGIGMADLANATQPTITVQGRGEVQAAPDQLLLDVGVVTTAATAREAQAENARRADQVIRGFVALNI